jgi:MoaA/NifB/PqqE/SkfB family radical SAM enzyme
MNLTSIHFLLSYRCTRECDHCFLWGSPRARGTMTLAQIRDVLQQAKGLGTVTSVCFEGGEPFLFYPIMLGGLYEAAAMGLRAGIVSNCYWATSVDDAVEWLRPIADVGVDHLGFSSDLFHGETRMTDEARHAVAAAKQLGLSEDIFTIERPEGCDTCPERSKGEPITGGSVRFRGRAVAKLTDGVERRPWTDFTECPSEDFVELGRVHVDAHGNVHLCQGLVIGNVWRQSLGDIVASYHPTTHPVVGPLLAGGPVELVRQHDLPHEGSYIDACHLCYLARDALRKRFPETLTPGQVYGELAS